MGKKLLFAIASFLILVSALSLTSAYPYYVDDGYYNSYSYTSSRNSGYYGGPSQSSTTYYDRTANTRYLPYGGVEKSTTYTYTTRNYPNYYDGYYNSDYPPWYQKYWRTPSYPRNYYSFSYTPRYDYGYYDNYYDGYGY